MGEVPDWYPLVRAARYLGVPPWELDEVPYVWRLYALEAEKADATAKPSN